MKCYFPVDAKGERIGFKTPEACVYDQDGTSLTTKLVSINKSIQTHQTNKSNPHSVTKAQVGLGSVANYDQSKAIKSIVGNGTTYTCTALDGTTTTFKAGSPTSGPSYTHPTYASHASGLYKITVDTTGHVSAATAVTKADITGLGIPGQDTTYSDATTSSHGLMTAAMVSKLNSITSGANTYTHPTHTAYNSGLYKVTVDALGHVTAATAVTKSDITALGIPGQDTNTTYSNMKAASTSTDGGSGLVPAPAKGDANRFLRSDGTWAVPVSSSSGPVVTYTHPIYPEHASGLYKITVDNTGHVSAATAVTKADITALGIPGQDTNTTYTDATTSAHGLMTAAMVSKLNGIANGANAYVHPSYTSHASGLYKVTVDGTGHVSAATAVTKSDITALGIPGQDTNTTYSNMKAATTSASGASGLVPAPTAGASNRYLRSDGTWATPPDTNTTYNDATTSAHGLMTAAMVTKLNGIAAGAQVNAVTSVAGRTGAITLAKADVGLGNVDNTADSAKSVKFATAAGRASSVAWANVSGKPELAYVSGASDLPTDYTGGDVWKAPS